jgi:hypothetical protein
LTNIFIVRSISAFLLLHAEGCNSGHKLQNLVAGHWNPKKKGILQVPNNFFYFVHESTASATMFIPDGMHLGIIETTRSSGRRI